MDAKRSLRGVATLFALCFAALAADSGQELLTAARNGDTAGLRALLGSAVDLEAKGNDGKTALMLAAEEGHAEIVRLLLEKGANTQARDKEGLTAYALALLSSPGKHDAILALLPKPPLVPIDVDALWLPVNMTGSCFQSRAELARAIGAIHPDALALGAFAEFARTTGKEAVEILRADSQGPMPDAATPPATGASATVVLAVRPGVSCSKQSDFLSLAIDVRVIRAGGGAPVYRKTFGGGLKGLHEQAVTNPAQYPPFFEKWARAHTSSIYWEVLRALLRQ